MCSALLVAPTAVDLAGRSRHISLRLSTHASHQHSCCCLLLSPVHVANRCLLISHEQRSAPPLYCHQPDTAAHHHHPRAKASRASAHEQLEEAREGLRRRAEACAREVADLARMLALLAPPGGAQQHQGEPPSVTPQELFHKLQGLVDESVQVGGRACEPAGGGPGL